MCEILKTVNVPLPKFSRRIVNNNYTTREPVLHGLESKNRRLGVDVSASVYECSCKPYTDAVVIYFT